MSEKQNPVAVYDLLCVVSSLQKTLGGTSQLEIQRVSFLACILSLFSGQPVADWGYRFARTSFGTPFSAEIDNALQQLTSSGALLSSNGRFNLSETGESIFAILSALRNFTERNQFLYAACSSIKVIPPGTLSIGIENEPTILSSKLKTGSSILLDGPSVQLLHEHFDGLSQVLGNESSDLVVPAVVWITYMAQESLSIHKEA